MSTRPNDQADECVKAPSSATAAGMRSIPIRRKGAGPTQRSQESRAPCLRGNTYGNPKAYASNSF